MRLLSKLKFAITAAIVTAVMSMVATTAMAQKKVVIGATGNIYGWNPYQDSAAQMYGIWCNVYGCLCRYDFKKAGYSPMLAKSWSINDLSYGDF